VDIAAWLHGLGLQHYEQAFRDNDVDGEVLRRLTAQDLRELGVASIGNRRRLLDAIAALGAEAPAVTDLLVRADAERRQLTGNVLRSGGSTALASRLDPEDLREVIAAYHRAVAEIVAGLMVLSRNTWATACWSISATRERMRTMPSGRSGGARRHRRRRGASMSNPPTCKRASGSPPGWWSSAI